jgi:hypothetical protein
MSPSSTVSPGQHADEQRRLSSGECRRWLEQHRQGRLGYLSGRGPRSVVVSYAVVGDQILVKVPDYNDIAHYAPGAQVTLAVDGKIDHTAVIEEVSVTGTAGHQDGNVAVPGDAVQFDESWPAAIKTSVVTLPLTGMEGVRRPAGSRRLGEHQNS